MPAEWDTYLERMGAEEANAPYEHKARLSSGRANSLPFSALRGYEGNAHRSRAKRHRGRH